MFVGLVWCGGSGCLGGLHVRSGLVRTWGCGGVWHEGVDGDGRPWVRVWEEGWVWGGGRFWCFSVFGRGKEEGFFVFGIFFFEGGSVAGQVCVLVRVKKEAAPLIGEVFGGDGVRQGCLVWLVCGKYGHDACVGRGGRCGQDMVGVATSVSRGGGDMKKRAPSCVYQRREGQVRAGDVACVVVPAWCTWHGGTAWLGVARHVGGCGVGCCVW